jgi:hypothetical protein
MNFSRTKLLDKWCDEMTKVAEARSKQILTENFDHVYEIDDEIVNVYPDLTNKEKDECRKLLSDFYKSFAQLLIKIKDWRSVVYLIQECWQVEHNYLESKTTSWSLMLNPQTGDQGLYINICLAIGIELRNFFSALLSAGNFDCVLTESHSWSLDDLITLSDIELIVRLSNSVEGKTNLEKVKTLSKFKDSLRQLAGHAERNQEDLEYIEFDHTRLAKRNLRNIYGEIDKLIFQAISPCFLRSREQLKILINVVALIEDRLKWLDYARDERSGHAVPISWVIDSKKIGGISERLNSLIDNNKVIVIDEEGQANDPGFKLPEKAKSSDIIRALLSKISYFNDRYEDDQLELKLWIYYLFINEEGFSLNHILTAPKRTSKQNIRISLKEI